MTLAAGIFLTVAVAIGAPETEAAPAELVVEPSELTLRVGESATLQTKVLDAEGNELDQTVLFLPLHDQRWNLRERTWGFNLFKVSPDGSVAATRPGSYRIMVRVPRTDGDADGTWLQQIVPLEVVRPPIERLELADAPKTLYQGTLIGLDVRLFDGAGDRRTDVQPSFSSSDPDVAFVDSFGFLQLVSAGEAKITVTADAAEMTFDAVVQSNPATRLELEASAVVARAGDVVRYSGRVLDAGGRELDVPVTYSFQGRTDPLATGGPSSGLIDDRGRFVADLPGEYTILATSGTQVAMRRLTVEPRGARREIELVGHGRVKDRATSDLWVWEGADGRDYAITGTHSASGHAYIWDVTEPNSLEIIDTVKVDARTVNDVKVSDDGRIAVLSREGASNRRNGVVVLDVSEPQVGVRILSTFDDELTGGVHNTFLYEDHLYALSNSRRYDVISLEDPAQPKRVGRFELSNPDRSIHDVVVHDGIAYSANWTDGVVLVDVGGGELGGSPSEPKMIGSFPFPTGWNHAVYPYRSESTGQFYIFAGDEAARSGPIFSPKSEIGTGTPGYDGEPARWRGWIHVLAWNPGEEPELVARYEVPEAGSHNIWIEDDVMYVAFYNGGLRVVDVSGELMGDLYRQGREIARFLPYDPEGYGANAPQVWGAQPHKGTIFFSDFNSGLWAVRLGDGEEESSRIDGSGD
ncbi:MAG: hypothetical protein AAF690_09100 [Acidobacteriota bacterium]